MRLALACDSVGAIGPKPRDALRVPGYVVGRFACRVPLMELLALGAEPLLVACTLCVEPDPTGREIMGGVRDEVRAAGLDPQAVTTGSTEKNVPTSQTGVGVTAVPVLQRTRWGEEELPRRAAFFPLVGAVLGGPLWGLDALCAGFLGPLPRAALLLGLLFAATGGLHLDGLADTCDALLSRARRQRALNIMRQGRIGALGAAALVLALLLRFALYTDLEGPLHGPTLFLTAVIGRQAMALAMISSPPARPGPGLGRAFARRLGPGTVAASLAFSAAALAGGLAASGAPAAGGGRLAAAGLISGQAAAAAVSRRLGGVTGDVYGAVNEAAELAMLLVAGALAGWGAGGGG